MAPRQPPKPEEPIVTLRLIGVQIDGSSRRALIATSSGSRVWVDERGAVAGWTVESITANEVTVKGRGGRNILALYRASEGKR